MTDENKTVAQMPTFDFSACDITTDAQLDEELAKAKTFAKYFEPGKYDVTIEDVRYLGQTANDPNWGKLGVTLKGAQDRTIDGLVLLPFRDVRYGAKKTMYPFKSFQSFCTAVGVHVTRENLEQTLKSTFSRPEKLKGATVTIEVGYESGYVKYGGKNDAGVAKYSLYTQDGNIVCGGDKQPLAFPDRAAAIAYAGENQITIDEYVRVLKYAPSANGSGLKAADANW